MKINPLKIPGHIVWVLIVGGMVVPIAVADFIIISMIDLLKQKYAVH